MRNIMVRLLSVTSIALVMGAASITYASAGGGEDEATKLLRQSISAELDRRYQARKAKKKRSVEVSSTNDRRSRR